MKRELKKEPMTAAMLILNLLVFLLVEITGGSQGIEHMLECGAAYTPIILEDGQWYRLFTCMFLHFGMEHLANNMLVLFVLGGRLERTVGKIKFLIIYILGGMAGNILSLILDIRSMEFAVSAGASGAVFAVMGAMIYVLLRSKGRVEDITVRQMVIMAAFSLYFGLTSSGVDNAAHIGGMLSGFVLAVILYHPRKIRTSVP
ncbi:MAG: rhomboid family intramembrane serine protease [Blautia sp.]|nr:rhomboid family intramembrane serine protease [Blautia sp.]